MRRLPKMLAVLAAAMVSIVLSSTPAWAAHGNGLHWAGSGVRTVAVVDKTQNPAWQQKLDRVIAAWNAGTTNVRLVHRYGTGGCSMNSRAIEVCLGGSSYTSWRYSAGHFLGVAVTLNSSLTTTGEAITCHEIGHGLGLGHRVQEESSSCMTPVVYSGQTRPDAHDHATVFAQHNH